MDDHPRRTSDDAVHGQTKRALAVVPTEVAVRWRYLDLCNAIRSLDPIGRYDGVIEVDRDALGYRFGLSGKERLATGPHSTRKRRAPAF